MIERYQLRYFLAVVDAGNFSRAARQVNVSQPALSIAIAKLEQALGAQLFLRNSQRVNLTEEGGRLLVKARAIEGEFNALAAGLADQPRANQIRLGVLSTVPTRIIANLVEANARSPQPLALEIVEGSERELTSRLQRRRIDAAFTLFRPEDTRFDADPVHSEGYSLVAPRDHPLADRAVAPGEAFANDVMIVRRQCEVLAETSRYFTERGVRPRFAFRSFNDERVLALVKAGLGVALAPDSLVDEELAAIKLAGFDQRRRLGLLYADQASRRRAVSLLARLQAAWPDPDAVRSAHPL